jgi:hypothetical protein
MAEGSVVTKVGIMPISEALRQGMITLDDLTGAEFRQIKGKLRSVRDDTLYDTKRLKGAATVWSKGDYEMFDVAKGGNVTMANAATAYNKTKYDTNLLGPGGQMTPGINYVVQSIQFAVRAPANEDTTPLLGGTAIDPTPVANASPSIISSAALISALAENVGFSFHVDDRDYENGPIETFPTEMGISGAFGGQVAEGFAQIGMGRARYLSRVRHLNAGQRFGLTLTVYNDITITRSCRLKCYLVGTRYAPVQ